MIDLPIPYEKLNPKSISDRFWGADPKQNYFARAKNIVLTGELNRQKLLLVQQEFGDDLAKSFAVQWRELLEEITFQIAIDGHIDSDERAFFNEYIAIFKISKDEAARIYRTGARRAIMDIVSKLIQDWDLSKADLEYITKISNHFGLNAFEADSSIKEQLQLQINARLLDMLEDDLITDDEWDYFNSYCESLNIKLSMTEETKRQVDQARKHWRLQFGELMPLNSVSIKLKPSEEAFFVGRAKWYENRKVKGDTVLKKLCEGELIMTNKRVLLIADYEDNRSTMWSGVVAVNRLSSTKFELEKSRGKTPLIKVFEAPDNSLKTASLVAKRLFECS